MLEGVWRDGHTHYCPLHYRIRYMKQVASRAGKSVPSREELEVLIQASGMHCPACQKEMIYRAWDHVGAGSVVSLQHWRDGTHGVVCKSCNSRDLGFPNDAMLAVVPPDHKYCPICETVKPRTDFYVARARGGTQSYCKVCMKLKLKEFA